MINNEGVTIDVNELLEKIKELPAVIDKTTAKKCAKQAWLEYMNELDEISQAEILNQPQQEFWHRKCVV
ncbi:hypothetical protein ACFLUB_00405 [Chloroflexota bacterium]